jgi:tight adherence protein B
MSFGQESILYIIIFFCGFMGLQAVMDLGRQASIKVKVVNDRMKRMNDDAASQMTVLDEMRKDRGIRDDDNFASKISYRINQMVVQSGLKLGAFGIYKYMVLGVIILTPTLFIAKESALWGGLGFTAGLILPLGFVHMAAKRRRAKAVAQLPEALDVIVRSLGAGHPVPVAMALVAKEMPDPIGSEFGMVSDEIAFGSQLTNAVQRFAERIGHPDFDLFAAMIRLQERTGGNLAQLLRANSNTIRGRQKMRLKIKAASAEGRMSAMILNLAPIAVFLLVNVLSPDFYGSVSDNPVDKKTFIGVTIWMVIGNLFMRKMINFKI